MGFPSAAPGGHSSPLARRMPHPVRWFWKRVGTAIFAKFTFHVSFVFMDLAWNCSHVIDSIGSYSYPCQPVGLRRSILTSPAPVGGLSVVMGTFPGQGLQSSE